MYIINATHKVTKQAFRLDLHAATLGELESVFEPGRLLQADKLEYFKAKAAAERRERIKVLRQHHARLKCIIQGLKHRAWGDQKDQVHQKLRETAAQLEAILRRYLGVVKEGKALKELDLTRELKVPLAALRDQIPEPEEDAQHRKALAKARVQVGDVLARAEAGARAWIQGSNIIYRGSLATGWRNAKKSVDGTAQRIDVLKFDSDAFIEVPATTWAKWNALGVVTDIKKNDKMGLGDLQRAAAHALQAATPLAEAVNASAEDAQRLDDLKRLKSQLDGIATLEEQIRGAMQTVSGYKKDGSNVADFGFVLQPPQKTERELKSGNLYPLDEVAKAGLPLTEAALDVVYSEGTLQVRMPETHVSMSMPVTDSTYGWAASPAPHTQARPTEAMLIQAYFANPQPLTATGGPVVRSLMDHVRGMAPVVGFTFDDHDWEIEIE